MRERKQLTRGKSWTWVRVEKNSEFWSINRVMQKHNQPTLARPYFLSFRRRGMSEGIVFGPPTKRWIYAFSKLSKTTPRNVMTSKLRNAHWWFQARHGRVLYKRRRGDRFVLYSCCFKIAGLSLCVSGCPVVSVVYLRIPKHPTQHLHKVDALQHSPL